MLEYESDIKIGLFAVAKVLTGLMSGSEEFSKKMLIQISNSVDDAYVGLQKISEYMDDNFGKLNADNQAILDILQMMLEQNQTNITQKDDNNTNDQVVKFKNNKKQDYIKNWNSRLFLHQDNDERPLTLADTFIMPDYESIINFLKIAQKDLGQVIDKFINRKRTLKLLITGVPGMGKSSIVSWIANKYKNDDRIIILRFRDWEIEELKDGLLKAIFSTLKCNKEDLEGKILILEGFDEIKLLKSRQSLLDSFLTNILDYKNLKLIITSRIGYINPKEFNEMFVSLFLF